MTFSAYHLNIKKKCQKLNIKHFWKRKLLGVGGVFAVEDAVAYARAGASLVQIGTATFAAPRAAQRIVKGLERWGRRRGVGAWTELRPESPRPETVDQEDAWQK